MRQKDRKIDTPRERGKEGQRNVERQTFRERERERDKRT